jgi:hypothetical protein
LRQSVKPKMSYDRLLPCVSHMISWVSPGHFVWEDKKSRVREEVYHKVHGEAALQYWAYTHKTEPGVLDFVDWDSVGKALQQLSMSWRHGVRMLILLAQILHKYFYKNYRIGDVEGRQTMRFQRF